MISKAYRKNHKLHFNIADKGETMQKPSLIIKLWLPINIFFLSCAQAHNVPEWEERTRLEKAQNNDKSHNLNGKISYPSPFSLEKQDAVIEEIKKEDHDGDFLTESYNKQRHKGTQAQQESNTGATE